MSVSDNIKAIRNQRGIAQAEVARRLEIEPSSYHRLENRGDKMTLEQVDSIAQALGVTRLELLTWGEQTVDKSISLNDEQQQKKLDELEDRLKDKQTIINNLNKSSDHIADLVRVYMDYLKEEVAVDLKLGTITYNDDQGVIQSMPWSTFENLSIDETHKIESTYDFDFSMSEEDHAKVIETMFTDVKYKVACAFLMNTGFIKDKKLLDAYERNFESMYRWMSVSNFDTLTKGSNRALARILKRNTNIYL